LRMMVAATQTANDTAACNRNEYLGRLIRLITAKVISNSSSTKAYQESNHPFSARTIVYKNTLRLVLMPEVRPVYSAATL